MLSITRSICRTVRRCIPGAVREHFLEIVSRAECLAMGCNHHYPHRRVAGDVAERGLQRIQHFHDSALNCMGGST